MLSHQHFISANFYEPTSIQNEDQISHANCGEAMRYKDRAPPQFPSLSPLVAAALRAKSACSVSASKAAVGSSSTRRSKLITHETTCERELLPDNS
jgi:hypothetical protein